MKESVGRRRKEEEGWMRDASLAASLFLFPSTYVVVNEPFSGIYV